MKVRFVCAHFRLEVSVSFCMYVDLCTTVLVGKTVVKSVIQMARKKFQVLPIGVKRITFWFTSPDALPLSYRRLVGAKVIKLGSSDKRSAYC